MFRRIINATRSFLRNSPSPPVQNVQRPSAPSVINQAEAPLFDPVKSAAYHELKEAVKELSLGAAQPFTTPSKDSLKAWDETPPEQLKRDQLEELARAYFEGVGGLPQDRSKSVELWAIASKMGSIEGRYSRASCLRDGVGVEKDLPLAFKELEALATQNNYNFAHVSIIFPALPLILQDSLPN